MANKQEFFFNKVIYEYEFDLANTEGDSLALGAKHLDMSKHGFQPRQLDMWSMMFMDSLKALLETENEEQTVSKIVDAYREFLGFITMKIAEGYKVEPVCRRKPRKKKEKVDEVAKTVKAAGEKFDRKFTRCSCAVDPNFAEDEVADPELEGLGVKG